MPEDRKKQVRIILDAGLAALTVQLVLSYLSKSDPLLVWEDYKSILDFILLVAISLEISLRFKRWRANRN
ncbi:hypothetical protein ACX3VT_07750 [Aerococcus sanguinicola]|uniref:hypothetical protein n=1 Tax=unclassified Aerococcus TaxID=2618060 RepID=UPI0008A62BDF|nr:MULTISPECIES: hypothetical protein [unclassified Aerococcus]KAB0646695.1 hypothetical protein F6I01_05740 [Aerococcus sanguinicola]MDK6233840.1 hypothetical protein [Aerococcus sp. UMB10185]MDK6805779.1 hypothetical protein [Aerococcus sp. UMB7834]MDK6856329.1 hypothetical protein [Aerococcus sp. UMB7533]MDK8503123.1 hypothetical protein [Aerococcus sp. UMB1112A]